MSSNWFTIKSQETEYSEVYSIVANISKLESEFRKYFSNLADIQIAELNFSRALINKFESYSEAKSDEYQAQLLESVCDSVPNSRGDILLANLYIDRVNENCCSSDVIRDINNVADSINIGSLPLIYV